MFHGFLLSKRCFRSPNLHLLISYSYEYPFTTYFRLLSYSNTCVAKRLKLNKHANESFIIDNSFCQASPWQGVSSLLYHAGYSSCHTVCFKSYSLCSIVSGGAELQHAWSGLTGVTTASQKTGVIQRLRCASPSERQYRRPVLYLPPLSPAYPPNKLYNTNDDFYNTNLFNKILNISPLTFV